jgi:hypothetical protein
MHSSLQSQGFVVPRLLFGLEAQAALVLHCDRTNG